MEKWEHFSGTGEQQQEQAFRFNLEEIKKNLKDSIDQADLIASKEPVKKILDAAQKLIEEIDNYSQKE